MRKLSKRKDKRPGKKNAVLDSNARMNDFSTSANSLVEQILNLQKTIGNQAVQRLFSSPGRHLPDSVHSEAGELFGKRVDHVHLHDNNPIPLLFGAKALTAGNHIFLHSTFSGVKNRSLLMHELTHVATQDTTAGRYSGIIPQSHPAEQVARSIENGKSRELTASPVGIYCSPMKRADFEKEIKRRFSIGRIFTATCNQHKEFLNYFGEGKKPGDKLDCSKWSPLSPGADSAVYDWILGAFAGFAKGFGGIPSVKEIGFYPKAYEPDSNDNLVEMPKVAAEYGGGRLAIYEAAYSRATDFEVPTGRSVDAESKLRDMTKEEGLKHSIYHELGHGLQETALTPREGGKAPIPSFMSDYRKAVGWTTGKNPKLYDAGVLKVQEALVGGKTPPAEYRIVKAEWNNPKWVEQPISKYMTYNPADDFAEAISAYLNLPDILKKRSPNRFAFIENHKAKLVPYLRKDIGPIKLFPSDEFLRKYIKPKPDWLRWESLEKGTGTKSRPFTGLRF